MKKLLIASSIVLALGAALACKSKSGATPGSSVSCKPGSRTICLCPNKDKGTWVCTPKGDGFGKCELGEGLSCEGTANPTDGGVDPCAAASVTLSDTPQSFTDDTSAGESFVAGLDACSNTSTSKEKIYLLTATKDGNASVTVEPGTAFDPTLYVRNDVCGKGAQVACSEAGGAGKPETITFNVTAGSVYSVVVDGNNESTGTFKVSFVLATAACGNNKVERGEACDDGNTVAGDGCSADCAKVTDDPASGNLCPGQPLHVWSAPVTATGTMGNYADYKQVAPASTCPDIGGNPPGQGQPEHIYNVTAHKTGTLNVLASTTDNTFDFVLYARATCDNDSSELVCSNGGGKGTNESLSFPVVDGTSYMVGIDGVGSGDRGPFTLTFSIP